MVKWELILAGETSMRLSGTPCLAGTVRVLHARVCFAGTTDSSSPDCSPSSTCETKGFSFSSFGSLITMRRFERVRTVSVWIVSCNARRRLMIFIRTCWLCTAASPLAEYRRHGRDCLCRVYRSNSNGEVVEVLIASANGCWRSSHDSRCTLRVTARKNTLGVSRPAKLYSNFPAPTAQPQTPPIILLIIRQARFEGSVTVREVCGRTVKVLRCIQQEVVIQACLILRMPGRPC